MKEDKNEKDIATSDGTPITFTLILVVMLTIWLMFESNLKNSFETGLRLTICKNVMAESNVPNIIATLTIILIGILIGLVLYALYKTIIKHSQNDSSQYGQ